MVAMKAHDAMVAMKAKADEADQRKGYDKGSGIGSGSSGGMDGGSGSDDKDKEEEDDDKNEEKEKDVEDEESGDDDDGVFDRERFEHRMSKAMGRFLSGHQVGNELLGDLEDRSEAETPEQNATPSRLSHVAPLAQSSFQPNRRGQGTDELEGGEDPGRPDSEDPDPEGTPPKPPVETFDSRNKRWLQNKKERVFVCDNHPCGNVVYLHHKQLAGAYCDASAASIPYHRFEEEWRRGRIDATWWCMQCHEKAGNTLDRAGDPPPRVLQLLLWRRQVCALQYVERRARLETKTVHDLSYHQYSCIQK